MQINSASNETYKDLQKLNQKKYRDIKNLYLIFGDDLILEAKKNQLIVKYLNCENEDSIFLSDKLMLSLQEGTSFTRGAIVKKNTKNIDCSKILVLNGVGDPTNVGSLLRSAAAFGFEKIVCDNNTADYYNTKTVRVSKGAIFYLSLIRCDLVSYLNEKRKEGYIIVGADAHSNNTAVTPINKVCLVLGSEGLGLSTEVKEICDSLVCIKTNYVESLNVSVAGSIIMHYINLGGLPK